MEPRTLRGAEIVRKGGLKKRGRYLWVVPSQTHAGHYVVDTRGDEPTCTCPDYESRSAFCKHVFSVLISTRKVSLPAGYLRDDEHQPVGYTQDWASYNTAQQREKEHFVGLLRELCDGIKMPAQKGRGRPRAPLADVVFACVMKVYGTQSGRRSTTDIKACRDQDLIDVAPHYNTISKYLGKKEITPLLRALLLETASPLADIETVFAADATGFSTCQHKRWYDHKWGKERSKQKWVKAHAISGTQTNIVTDVVMTGSEGTDTKQLEALLETTAGRFSVKEVTADKAYLSRDNLMAIDSVGAVPYIPFKEGTGHGKNMGKGMEKKNELWRRMYHYYQYRQDEFFDHYHQRSNAETVFSMVKMKFGGAVRSKKKVPQFNEVLCKFICHNICVLIKSIYELGIEPEFWKSEVA